MSNEGGYDVAPRPEGLKFYSNFLTVSRGAVVPRREDRNLTTQTLQVPTV